MINEMKVRFTAIKENESFARTCVAGFIANYNPTVEELSAWRDLSGMPLRKFFNTSGLLYKSMELKDKLPAMSDEEMLKLLASDGMLVKRPLVIGDEVALVGFKEAEWEKNLK